MDDQTPPLFAKARNPDLDLTDVRLRLHRFTLDMIESELHFQLRHGDPGSSRNLIITKILGDYARRRWEQARIRLGLSPDNPFVGSEPPPPTYTQPQPDECYVEVRAKLPKFTMDVLETEAQHRRLYLGLDATRLTVIGEVLNTWANLEWHRANMHLAGAPSNPLMADSLEGAHV